MSTSETLIAALKAHLYPPRSSAGDEALRMLGTFVNLHHKSGRENAAVARPGADMACHLLHLMRQSSDARFLQTGLRALLNLDRFGRLAATRYLREKRVPLEELAPLAAAMPQRERLGLLQELLRRPWLNDRQLRLWIGNMLSPLKDCDLAEGLRFLRELSRANDRAAPLLRRTLLSKGTFDSSLRLLFEDTPEPETLHALAEAVHALADAELTRSLAACLERNAASVPAEALPALSRTDDAREAGVAAVLVKLIPGASSERVLACVDGLIQMKAPETAAALASLLRDKELRTAALARLPYLPEPIFLRLSRAFPERDRLALYVRLLGIIARVEPDFVEGCLELPENLGTRALDPETTAQIRKWLRSLRASPLFDNGRTALSPPERLEADDGKSGFFARLMGERKIDVAETIRTTPELKRLDLAGGMLRDFTLAARPVRDVAFDGTVFQAVRLDKLTMSGTTFTDCTMTEVVFSGCTFTDCSFRGARLHECAFRSCTFERCDFGSAAISETVLHRCAAEETLLTGAKLLRCSGTLSVLRLCSLAGALLQDCTIRSCSFPGTTFVHARLLGCALRGTEFEDCDFFHARFDGCTLVHCPAKDCAFAGNRMRGVETQEPEFLYALVRSHLANIPDLTMNPLPALPVGLKSGHGPAFAARTVERWIRQWEIARFERRMLLHNHQRLRYACRRMNERQERFFRMVPYLLHSDVFDQKFDLNAPQCVVAGYYPDLRVLELVREHLPDARPTRDRNRVLRIEAVYTIGSLGSVAQTPRSDVDYWLCYDPQGTTPEDLPDLRRKLEAMERWAMDEFGLEVHFFAMSLDDVRANDFGLSDKESSGSAQALLLKEEFYRTALKVAGKTLTWWILPPDADERTYRHYQAAAANYPVVGSRRLADLGHLARLPAEEFFGACLWQIVKGVTSPYKSVLKLGLLEKYAGQREGVALCETIKANVLARRRAAEDVDPYTLLFKKLRDYYLGLGDRNAVNLLRASINLKSGIDSFDMSYGAPYWEIEDSFLNFLHRSDRETPLPLDAKSRKWSFKRSMQVGEVVNNFMINAYERIQSRLDGEGAGSLITPEDLTRLGRRISSNFARRENKVMRIPFIDIREGDFRELFFWAEKSATKPPVWKVRGQEQGGSKHMADLSENPDPLMLLAWLVINRVHTPDAVILGEGSIAPLSLEDIRNLLTMIRQHFPAKDIFEGDLDETLRPERITRALLVPNLTVPREKESFLQLSLLYATNWGEVFCRSIRNPDPGPAMTAPAQLAFYSGGLPINDALIKVYIPKKMKGPRISST